MKATVQIKMNGSAFNGPHTHLELARILNKIADSVERNVIEEVGHECSVADSNGNYVAQLEIKHELPPLPRLPKLPPLPKVSS